LPGTKLFGGPDCPINTGAVMATIAASTAAVIGIRDMEIRLVMPHIVHRPLSASRAKLSRFNVSTNIPITRGY
jgi:hypothetical protein